MRSLLRPAVAVLFFCTLFGIHSIANAEEAKSDSSAQSSVTAQGSKDQSKDETAKTDKSEKKSSSDPEPECNN